MMLPQSFYADDKIRKCPALLSQHRNTIDDKNKLSQLNSYLVAPGGATVNMIGADVRGTSQHIVGLCKKPK